MTGFAVISFWIDEGSLLSRIVVQFHQIAEELSMYLDRIVILELLRVEPLGHGQCTHYQLGADGEVSGDDMDPAIPHCGYISESLGFHDLIVVGLHRFGVA